MEDDLEDLDNPIGGENDAEADKGVDDFTLTGLDGLRFAAGGHQLKTAEYKEGKHGQAGKDEEVRKDLRDKTAEGEIAEGEFPAVLLGVWNASAGGFQLIGRTSSHNGRDS